MKIIFDTINEIYSLKNRILGNCITIYEDSIVYTYEFEISQKKAIIYCEDFTYIEDAVEAFHKKNPYIATYQSKDGTFYKSFDEVFTFKLPISVIQPSKFFINQEQLEALDTYISDFEEIYIPVAILQEEYVALDSHTKLLVLYQNHKKLVNVYLSPYDSYIQDFVYLAKENNIFNISKVPVVSKEEYETYWLQFWNDYFNMNETL